MWFDRGSIGRGPVGFVEKNSTQSHEKKKRNDETHHKVNNCYVLARIRIKHVQEVVAELASLGVIFVKLRSMKLGLRQII